MNPRITQQYLSVKETATLLGVSTDTVYRLIKDRKELRAIDLNAGLRNENGCTRSPLWRIPLKDIEKLMGDKL